MKSLQLDKADTVVHNCVSCVPSIECRCCFCLWQRQPYASTGIQQRTWCPVSFSVLIPLFGSQEGHPTCKNCFSQGTQPTLKQQQIQAHLGCGRTSLIGFVVGGVVSRVKIALYCGSPAVTHQSFSR